MVSFFKLHQLCRMSRRLPAAALICGLFLTPAAAPGQAPALSRPENTNSAALSPPPGFMDSTSADSASALDTRVKSPGGALLRAMVLPGWGQFYTGHPVRGTLAAVLETTFFTMSFTKYRDRSSLRDELRELEKTAPVDDPLRIELNQRIKTRGQQGGDYLAYGLTTLMLSLIDSYVSAHLYRFDRNFQVQANPGRVQLCYRF
jgi:Family of unknown function (DUF5683)